MTKSIIITGVSGGIGLATAERAIAEGYVVTGMARSTHRLEDLKAQWGDRIEVMTGDVRSIDDTQELAALAMGRFGQIDVLINNAGLGVMGPMERADIEDWHTMMDVNVKGVLNCIHACLPHLLDAAGQIINVASVAAHDVFPGAVVYCASKHAVDVITRGIRKEFRSRVRVANISPGPVATDFVSQTHDEDFLTAFKTNWDGAVIHAEDIASAAMHIIQQPAHLAVNEYIIRPNK